MKNIIGIDLGTTYSAIAMLNSIGKPEIIPNADGERTTPSAIYFDEDSPDLIRVGVEAINSRYINAKRAIRWVKRNMGDAGYKLNLNGKVWTPVELSSLILKKVAQDAAAVCGKVEDAIISVPAHFDEIRRKATMDAGSLAGLNVIGIVNEPVAAALYYATSRPVAGKVLVYDLGGGTFDVTIMDVKGLQMDIICSQGDHALGGIDFDKKILEIIEKEYKDTLKADLISTDEERAKLEDEAEDIKKTLSRRPVAKKMIYGPAGTLKFEISREKFEEAISPLVSRIDMLIDVALEEASLKPSDITAVLLVGGSSRIPIVQKRLEKIFGFPPESTVNVDECVALGASLYAGLTMLREKPDMVSPAIAAGLADIKLTDVCNHSYGTFCAPVDKRTGKRIVQNRIILKKNTPLTCEETQVFYTMTEGQTALEATITQGEDASPEFVNKIGTYRFELPPDRPAHCPIKVTYKYDVNQRMHCKFEDVNSGRVLEIDFCLNKSGQMAQTDMKQKVQEMEALKVQ